MIHHDRHMVVVNKPSGLLMHRSRESQDETFLLQRLRDQIGQRVYPVHRLDRATSGLVVMALDGNSASTLGQQFQQGLNDKRYLALVRGWTPLEFSIGAPLLSEERGWQSARSHCLRLARAQLPWPVSRYPSFRVSLLQLSPLTGRRHQLRRHMNHLRHPILGDTTHGCRHSNQRLRRQLPQVRLFLHAWQLQLRHPTSGQLLQLHCPPAEDFTAACQVFGWGSGLWQVP